MRQTLPVLVVAALLGCSEADVPQAEYASVLRFEEVTSEAGLAGFRHVNGATGDYWFPETMGAGGGFVDLDGDGWLDIILVQGATWHASSDRALRVYRNQADGTFAPWPEAEPTGLAGYGLGIVAADFDNDGDSDIFYSSLTRDALLRNEGGRLVDVSAAAGVNPGASWSTAATFFDADNDGFLDLYVGRYVNWTPATDIYCSQDGQNKGYCTPELYAGISGSFYRNLGNGTFEDHTDRAGFAGSRGKTLGAMVMDHNRDGLADLMLANDTEPDELFLNRGDGSFEEIGVISGIAFDERGRARAGMGVAAGVVDQSGEESVFVGNFSSEMIGVYRHMGNDVFLDRAAASRIGQPSLLTLTFGLSLVDLDLDGDLDLFAANGHVQPHIEQVKENVGFRQVPHFFVNQGDGTFQDSAADVGLSYGAGWLARASAWGDIDNDGDADLLVTENGGPVHLLQNQTQGGRSVRVHLVGTDSNRDAIGARVMLYAEGGVQHRTVQTGGSYLAQSQFDPLFGLGEPADSLVVRWPSGASTILLGVTPGQTVEIVEGR